MTTRFKASIIGGFLLLAVIFIFSYSGFTNVEAPTNFYKQATCNSSEIEVTALDYSNTINPSVISTDQTIIDQVINYLKSPTKPTEVKLCLPQSRFKNNLFQKFDAKGVDCKVKVTDQFTCPNLSKVFPNTLFVPDRFNKVCTTDSITKVCENVINELKVGDVDFVTTLPVTQEQINVLKSPAENLPIDLKKQWNKKVMDAFGTDYSKYFNPKNGYLTLNSSFGALLQNIDDQKPDKIEELLNFSNKYSSLQFDPLIVSYKNAVATTLGSPASFPAVTTSLIDQLKDLIIKNKIAVLIFFVIGAGLAYYVYGKKITTGKIIH